MKFLRLNPITGVASRKIIPISTVLLISVTLFLTATGINLAGSIVFPEPELLTTPEPNYGDRELINPETRDNFAVTRELKRSIPCTVSFVKHYLNIQPSRIPVLVLENLSDSLDVAQLYLTALYNVRSTYLLSGHLDATDDHVSSLTALIIVEDTMELMNTTTQLIDLCGRDCKYLIVLTTTYPDLDSFIEDANHLILWLWDVRVANVVLLGTVMKTVFAARSLSFQRNVTSTPSYPEFVAVCDEDADWIEIEGNDESMYLPLKMNECIVHVAFFDYEPYVSVKREDVLSLLSERLWSNDTSNDLRPINDSFDATDNDTTVTDEAAVEITASNLVGIEGQVINALAHSLNFVIVAREIPWKNGTDLELEVHEALWGKGMEEVDVVLGGLPWGPKGETDYTLPYEVVQIVWVIPIHAHVSLKGLVSPLQTNVWYAVIGLLVFAGCIEMILTRNISFLEILSLVIGVSWPRQPIILSSRIRFISWVIFGYVLTQCYLASLSGQLMASSSVQIDTLKELVSTWMTIGGIASTKNLFMEQEGDHTQDGDDGVLDTVEINRIMMEKFHVFEHDEYAKNFHDLINERNDSLALAVTMNISSMKPSFEGKHVHRMKEALASYPLSFAVWRGMPYLSAIDKKISSLTEGGIIGYWARMISLTQGGYYDTEIRDDEVNLRLSALVPGFLLLIMGYGVAGIFLLCEVVIFHWLNRKNISTKRRLKRKIREEKLTGGSIPTEVVRKEGKALPEVLDTKTWIVGLNGSNIDGRKNERPVRRVNYPFEFVH